MFKNLKSFDELEKLIAKELKNPKFRAHIIKQLSDSTTEPTDERTSPAQVSAMLTELIEAILVIKGALDYSVAKTKQETAASKSPEDWKQVRAEYDEPTRTLTLFAAKSDFDPKFLKYMLEHMNLPADTNIKFKNPTEELDNIVDMFNRRRNNNLN